MSATDTSSEKSVATDLPVAVIGAGSSGIVAVKVLREHGLDAVCFERGSGIGGNWRFRNDNGMSAAYRSLHINTSKERMAYSDYPMPDSYPDYPHHTQILDYFEDYVDHFGIRDAIRFNTTVERVTPHPDGGWTVVTRPFPGEDAAGDDDGSDGDETSHRVRAVLVANGHHWCPRWPEPAFPGTFDGEVLHAHAYETPEGYAGKRVCVVGIGNSAVDIACELSRIADRVVLSTRRSAHILPKYAFGKPIDHFTTPSSSKLPAWIQGLGFKVILGLTRGPQERFGVPEPDHGLLAAHPTISAELLHLVGHGKIQVRPNLERLEGDEIAFVDGTREPFDVLIYCTGYRIRFPFLGDEILAPQHNEVRLYRNVVHPDHDGLFFIGLVQPLGAVMPISEAQSRWVARVLAGRTGLPDAATMKQRIETDREAVRRRYVTSDRHTIQVDFYPYLDQIRREMMRPA